MASPIQQPAAQLAAQFAAFGPRASTGAIAWRPRAAARQLIFPIVVPIAAILAVAPIPLMLIRFNLLVLRQMGIG